MSEEKKVRILGRQLGHEISVRETEDVAGGWIPVSHVTTGNSNGPDTPDADESDSRG